MTRVTLFFNVAEHVLTKLLWRWPCFPLTDPDVDRTVEGALQASLQRVVRTEQ